MPTCLSIPKTGLGRNTPRSIIGSQSRKRVDLKALADEIGASVLARFTSLRSMMVVRLRELSGG